MRGLDSLREGFSYVSICADVAEIFEDISSSFHQELKAFDICAKVVC